MQSIFRFSVFDETLLWVARVWRQGSPVAGIALPTDLPGGTVTVGVLTGLADEESAIYYYSNDLTRWWRRLSKALECELDRLRFIYPTGVPSIQ